MSIIHTVRLAVFGTVIVFTVIVLGLSAYFVSKVGSTFDHSSVFGFTAYGLALSILTLLVMVPILVVERIRRGAITSMVFVELAWVGLLWIMWLALGAAASVNLPSASVCSELRSPFDTLCGAWSAITAFAFLNWILLLGWFAALLVFAIRGNHWRNHVPDVELHKAQMGPTVSMHQTGTEKGVNAYPPPPVVPAMQAGYEPYHHSSAPSHPVPTPGSVPV